jgi:DNA-binding MarR family transcriptional regulator
MSYDQLDADQERCVTLSQKDIRAARRLLKLLLHEDFQSSAEQQLEETIRPASDISRTALVARAREEFGNRRRRSVIFQRSMFGEPAWDMLLALYILDVSGQRQTTGTLMHFSGAPITTARRWLDYLVENDLARRDHHPTDQRVLFVSLTAKGRDALDLYYSETVETEV